MLALTGLKMGLESYVIFSSDLYFSNQNQESLRVYTFAGDFSKEGYYLESFVLGQSKQISFSQVAYLHMRIDPPFDSRYLRFLWVLQELKKKGLVVLNDSQGILLHNEKLAAYSHPLSHASFVGGAGQAALDFLKNLKQQGYSDFILKPLDLYQGMGVQKFSWNDDLKKLLEDKEHEFGGMLVLQPYIKAVESGELRSIYFDGEHLGSIIKVPPSGSYLANIAQGATYAAIEPSTAVAGICKSIATELQKDGVRLIAYDILDEKISEVNVTCPGLLVEVSKACKRDLAQEILQRI